MRTPDARGLIAVDKMGGTVLFIDPVSDETTLVLDDFGACRTSCLSCGSPRPHMCRFMETASTAAIRPGHLLSVIDLAQRSFSRQNQTACLPYQYTPDTMGLHRVGRPNSLLALDFQN